MNNFPFPNPNAPFCGHNMQQAAPNFSNFRGGNGMPARAMPCNNSNFGGQGQMSGGGYSYGGYNNSGYQQQAGRADTPNAGYSPSGQYQSSGSYGYGGGMGGSQNYGGYSQ